MTPSARLLSPQDENDIQRLILRGTAMGFLRYHLLKVEDPVAARRFIGSLLGGGSVQVHTAGPAFDKEESGKPDHHLYMAFTYLGLEALRVPPVSLNSFPAAFREGAKARSASLGDSIPVDEWKYNHDEVHIVAMLYARDGDRLKGLSAAILDQARARGCSRVSCLDGKALPQFTLPSGQLVSQPVHFGFSDGISQPEILPAEAKPGAPPSVPPGTFVLGHPDVPETPGAAVDPLANEPMPLPTLMTRNGTFGAFLVMEQDCDAFEDFLDTNSRDAQSRELLAARLVGRWQNGVPLSLSPDRPVDAATGKAAVPRAAFNTFDYRQADPTFDDPRGLRCPIGSHVRRGNPRSGEILGGRGQSVRLIRRGMPYGPAHNPKIRGDGEERGMLGLFLCASLQYQYEFIMKNWINDGLFARGLDPAERDPFVGAQLDGATFADSIGGAKRIKMQLQRFVKTRGTVYLFFPSVTGLRVLAHTNELHAGRGRVETNPIVERFVAGTKKNIGVGIHRDAHPKHHGIVRATFEIAPDVPANLRHGLFDTSGRYSAYVRFSNGRPGREPDVTPDIRGMAIKLLGVEGPKELDDEQRTQDFLLASHPVFFVPDATSYVDFFMAETEAAKVKRFPDIPDIFKVYASPLTIRYFSQTPYALGPDRAVKYSAHPIEPNEVGPITMTDEEIKNADPNYLRKALAAHLNSRPATFAFLVQLAPDAIAIGIDDATASWPTPFQRVATITIPQQDFSAPSQVAFAERISFNPWHSLADHRPLGSINMARRFIYQAASKLRHENEGITVPEPDGVTDF